MLNIDEDGAQGTAGETSVAVEIVALIRIIPRQSKDDSLTSPLGDFS